MAEIWPTSEMVRFFNIRQDNTKCQTYVHQFKTETKVEYIILSTNLTTHSPPKNRSKSKTVNVMPLYEPNANNLTLVIPQFN
jgi:hypothetical protein